MNYNTNDLIMIFDLAVALSASAVFTYITCRFIQDCLKEYFHICDLINSIEIKLSRDDLNIQYQKNLNNT